MKPVTQTELGDTPRANCVMAALASILEVDLSQLPDLYEQEQRGVNWLCALRTALQPFGLAPVIYDQTVPSWPPIAPLGWHIATGLSPRSDHMDHAVCAYNGRIVHDPHPAQAGLRDGKITSWILLLPLATPAGSGARRTPERQP